MESLLKSGVEEASLDGIPCYFDRFASLRAEWALEAFHLLWLIQTFAEESARQSQEPRLRRLTRDRLKANAQANREHFAAMKRLLTPLGADTVTVHDYFSRFGTGGGASSSLVTFYPNLLRDWSWETDENERSFELLRTCLPADGSLGKVLSLGAGACRLSYDLHVRCRPELTLATDVNPLLFLCAKRIVSGETLELYDFPFNPVDAASYGVKRKLRAPAPADQAFRLALTDATRPCFRSGAFDTVLTPWLIDVLPMDIHEFFPIVNRLLRLGGNWINFGPLLFRAPFARRYGVEEVLAVAEKAGFEIDARERGDLPYLRSPFSASSRTENALVFRARKVADVDSLEHPSAEAPRALPDWLSDSALPVAIGGDLRPLAASQAAFAHLLGLVDGQRSMDQLAGEIAGKFGTDRGQALAFVERSLRSLWEGLQGDPMLDRP